tara:strand:+ start:412 stop:657 length:246 start_codon:yes stop_codon:yes gene_type:complete
MKKTKAEIDSVIRREYRDELRTFFYFLEIPLRRKDARYSDNIRWLKDYIHDGAGSLQHGSRIIKLVNWLYNDSIRYPSKWL